MIRIKSPGRLCLFGEHQDYLGYPVISLAISKYIYLNAKKIPEKIFKIDLPDINQFVEIPLTGKELDYSSRRDYIKSAYNQFIRKNAQFKKGYAITITGDIPINAGVASSSALVIAWLYFLKLVGNIKMSSFELAVEGYNSEVKEFQEGGGMMDHFSSVFGNMLFLDPQLTNQKLTNYDLKLSGFVLGNSLEQKDTVEDLIKVKALSMKSFEELKKIMPNFNRYTTKLGDITPFLSNLRNEYQKKIIGNIHNRDITIKAKKLIDGNLTLLRGRNTTKERVKFYWELGHLFNLHHQQLKENIEISTQKIDKMLDYCFKSGSLGGKINGSGFGGTMFCLSPNNEHIMQNIIEELGGEAFVVETSNGVDNF